MKNSETKLPINISSFELLTQNNMLYVDKTKMIYNFISTTGRYFLSRPRRFGKTLLISLMRFLFMGKKEYFENLWIGKNNRWDFKPFPLILLDFNGITNDTPEEFKLMLGNALDKISKKYEISLKETILKEKFIELVLELNKKYDSKVVILIDEYDKPIIDHLGAGDEHLDIAIKNRKILKSFYGTMKENSVDNAIYFLFITGVSKFSHTSIFSELNNLTDMTMDKEYASLLGYTDNEITQYFQEWITKWHTDKGIPESTIIENLRKHYDGFRFSAAPQRVYNPISILHSLRHQDYCNYWFETATPTFLINLLVKKNFYLPKIESLTLYKSAFTTYELESLDPLALMFQTGYLTIKDVRQDNVFNFDFPNIEVKQAFLKLLMDKYARVSQNGKFDQFNIYDHFVNKRFKIAIHHFQSIFDTIPYSHEQDFMWFHRFFYIMFRNACTESRTLDTQDKIIVQIETEQSIITAGFSCKVKSEELMQCLLKNNYTVSDNDKEIYYLSIYFDTNTRRITQWEQDCIMPELLISPKNLTEPVKIIKIFLASSDDLQEERKALSLWISRKNKPLLKENMFLELVIWEDLMHSLQGQRIQDYFNKEMLDCDIVIALFYTRVGVFTKEEFDLAYDHLKDGKKPEYLFVGFKISPPERISSEYIEIIKLRKEIEDNEQLYISFESTDSLILKLDTQLNKIIQEKR